MPTIIISVSLCQFQGQTMPTVPSKDNFLSYPKPVISLSLWPQFISDHVTQRCHLISQRPMS